MNAKLLEKTFIDLGTEAGDYIITVISEMIDKNQLIPFNDETQAFSSKINDVFSKLITSSFEENYFFYGCNFKVFIDRIEAKKEEHINLALGKTEKVYYENALKSIDAIFGILLSENPLFYKTLITHTTKFHNGILKGNEDKFKAYYFLNKENKKVIERNFDEIYRHIRSKIDILKNTSNLIRDNQGKSINYNPSLWNENCFKFFEYLIKNYYTKKKRELTDIWHFLKRDLNEEEFWFYATQKQYSSFIKSHLNIELKNWQQSNFKYEETEKKRLKDLFNKYKTTQNN